MLSTTTYRHGQVVVVNVLSSAQTVSDPQQAIAGELGRRGRIDSLPKAEKHAPLDTIDTFLKIASVA
jgi:hypothetical protein